MNLPSAMARKSSLPPTRSAPTPSTSTSHFDGQYLLTRWLCSRTESKADSDCLGEASRNNSSLPLLSHPLRSLNETTGLGLCQFSLLDVTSSDETSLTAVPARYGWPGGVVPVDEGSHLPRVLLAERRRRTFRAEATDMPSL